MPDPNMRYALKIASSLGPYPHGWLEKTIKNPKHVAIIVHQINDILVGGVILQNLKKKELSERLNNIVKVATCFIYDREWINNGSDKTLCSVLLRLWVGCIYGAKTIALGTRDGPNTMKVRTRQMKKLRPICEKDSIFKAGVRASVDFKCLLFEPISFIGIESKDRREFFT